MLSQKKYLVVSVLLMLFIAVGIGYYFYAKPRSSAGSETTSVSLAAISLFTSYRLNEEAANKKYLGKILEVQGKVMAISHQDNLDVYSLYTGDAAAAINCQMFISDKRKAVKVGDNIIVKGKCTGFLMDVNLVDCIIK